MINFPACAILHVLLAQGQGAPDRLCCRCLFCSTASLHDVLNDCCWYYRLVRLQIVTLHDLINLKLLASAYQCCAQCSIHAILVLRVCHLLMRCVDEPAARCVCQLGCIWPHTRSSGAFRSAACGRRPS